VSGVLDLYSLTYVQGRQFNLVQPLRPAQRPLSMVQIGRGELASRFEAGQSSTLRTATREGDQMEQRPSYNKRQTATLLH
jgi:hypothetical protein